MALTEYYVTDAGAGDGLGGNEANAMSFASFVDYMSTGGSFTAAAGYRFNIIGTITSRATTSDTFVNGGTVASPVIIRGMAAGGALGYQGRTAGGGLVTTNMPTITYTTGRLNVTGAFIVFEGLVINGAPSNPTVTLAADCVAKSCKITNSSTNAAAAAVSLGTNARSALVDCDLELTGASGGDAAVLTQGAQRVIGNRIKGGPAVGIKCRSTTLIAFNTVFASAGHGIATDSNTGAPTIIFNTIVGNGGDGINIITGSTGSQFIFGNQITDNTGDGLDMVSTSNGGYVSYNRYRDNANSKANGGDWLTATAYGDVDSGTTGDTSTDYENYAGNDYRLVASSPSTSVAQPASLSIGALQRLQTGGGGGGSYAFIG